MQKEEGQKPRSLGKIGVFERINPRLKLTSSLVSAIGLVIASLVLTSDLSWVYMRKPVKVEGLVVRDLNKDNKQAPGDIGMGNIRVRAYRDLNKNDQVDVQDVLLDETYSDASGYFSLALPHLNKAVLKSEDFGAYATWSEEKELVLHFSDVYVEHIKNIKDIWLEVKAKSSAAQFASTNIRLDPAGAKIVHWDHKPWIKGRTYKSPNLKPLLKSLFEPSNHKVDIHLNLQFAEGEVPREVVSGVSLKVNYENKDSPFLITYESGFDPAGNAIEKKLKLENPQGADLFLPYEGNPVQCLATAKNGSLFHFNRYSQNGFPLSFRAGRDASYAPTLLSDPVSGQWMTIRNSRMQIINTVNQVAKWQDLQLPFCLNEKECISAYAYHPLRDEIWLLDKEFNLWKIGIKRLGEQLSFSPPALLHDWKEHKPGIAGKVFRMAIDPKEDEVYFLSKKNKGPFLLNKISIDGSEFRPLGPLVYAGKVLNEITGFDWRPEGKLWLLHVDEEAEEQQIFQVDPVYQLLSLISSVPVVEEIKSCACLATAPYKITAKVFDDKNLNEKIDEGERFLRNVRMNAFSPNKARMDSLELDPDEEGAYIFRTFRKGKTEFRIDKESLPAGIRSINVHSLLIPHEGELAGEEVTRFNFPVSHVSINPVIKWAGIRGSLSDGGIELEWATSSEEDSRYFEVLRSEDGINYEAVGGVESAGDSNEMQEYRYKDYLIDDLETPIVAYRVKMRGGLGKISYSPVTQVVVSEPSDGLDLKVRVHPSNESIRLTYQITKPGPAELRILNLTGSVMASIPLSLSKNGAEKNVPVKGWAKGMYYAQLRNGENSMMVRWILK